MRIYLEFGLLYDLFWLVAKHFCFKYWILVSRLAAYSCCILSLDGASFLLALTDIVWDLNVKKIDRLI